MENNSSRTMEEVYAVLDETLPVVHAALIGYYGFAESEAAAFEDTLCIWFHRVSRRTGIQSQSSRNLREQLLFVACKYARAFQIAKFRGSSVEDGLSIALDRPPEEVAVELLSRVQSQGVFS